MARGFIFDGCIRVAMRIVVERLVKVAISSANVVVDASTAALIVCVLLH